MVILLSTGGIIALAIGGAALVAGVFLILYFTLFKHLSIKKTAKALSARFEKSHAMLLGQDYQYIKRLETISSMNLTYVQDYVDFNRRFKDARDASDATAQASINSMQDLISERRYGELKSSLPTFKKNIDDYEKIVTSLDTALKHKFQEEEVCRQLAVNERERFRSVKQSYYAKQGDLGLVSVSLNAMFRKIESLFDEVDADIDNARYSNAKAILTNSIAPITDSLLHALTNLPGLCLSVTVILPEKLSRLSHRYDEMIEDKYPLYHILTKNDLNAIDDRLSKLASEIQGFHLKGANEAIDEINEKISSYDEALSKEVKSRERFEKETGEVSKEEINLESTFINLCHSRPTLKKFYVLDKEEQKLIDDITDAINKAGASKRSLDTYLNSGVYQPYSVLLEKMDNLKEKNQEASKAIEALRSYLSSLKNDSEEARSDLSIYYKKLRQSEIDVREINIEAVSKRFEDDFALLHEKLNSLSALLYTKPIDVAKVREIHSELTKVGDATFSSINQLKKDLSLAEETIVLMNRRRNSDAMINSLLTQAEGLFYKGDFKQAYEIAMESKRTYKGAQ